MAVSHARSSSLIAWLASIARRTDDERTVGGQRKRWRAETVQLAQQVPQVGGAWCRAVLG